MVSLGMDGTYKYTRDLMGLNTHAPYTKAADHRFGRISTPLNLSGWTQKLGRHPDRDYVDYILKGIQQGFQIGIEENRTFRPAKQNMH